MLYMKNPGVGRLPRMNALKYHFGLQMQFYPSSYQRKMIDFNSNNDRFLSRSARQKTRDLNPGMNVG